MVNFWRAAAGGAVVTLMSLPRLAQANARMDLYVPATWISMTLVCGAVTAWGWSAGMPGMWGGLGKTWRGTVIALFVALLALPVQHFLVAPVV